MRPGWPQWADAPLLGADRRSVGRRPRRATESGYKLAAAILAATAACSSGSSEAPTRPRLPLPRAAPVVGVRMVDHRFELDRRVPAGRVVFRITNAGRAPHKLTMVPLPEDLPPISEQLRGSQRRFLEPFAGIYERRPGDTGTFTVDLAPGRRYAMICSVVAEDGQPHWMKGMATEFRTAAAMPAAAG